MNIILFGGNSQRNKEWLHRVGDELRSDFDTLLVHEYAHWDGKGEFVDFDLELSRLVEATKGLDSYVVFAKSVGSLLTLMAMQRGILSPEKCVFAGLPIKLAEEDNIPLTELLQANVTQTLILQNTNDPVASYAKVVNLIANLNADNYLTVELPGDDHSYDDLPKIRSLVNNFIS